MTWVRIDDGAPHHEKLLRAGPDAAWLWVAALAHANRQTTDGVISTVALAAAYPWRRWTPRRLLELAATLVEVGLWEPRDDGGWYIHDYREYQGQAMREAVRARRDAEAVRKRAWRGRQQDGRVDSAADLSQPRGIAPVLSIAAPRETTTRSRNPAPIDGAPSSAGRSAPQHGPMGTRAMGDSAPVEGDTPNATLISPRDLVDVLCTRCPSSITLASAADARVMAALGYRLAELRSSRALDRRQIEVVADWYAAGAMRWRTTPLSLRELAHAPGRLADQIECALKWDADGRPTIDRDRHSPAPRDATQPRVSDTQYAEDRSATDPLAAVVARRTR